jgi:hypothetical protein
MGVSRIKIDFNRMIVPLAKNRSEAAVRQREVKLGYMKSKEQHRFAISTPPRLDCS